MKFAVFLLSPLFLLLSSPLTVFAFADVGVQSGSVSFSKSTLYTGDQVRVYATVRNYGDEDIAGSVVFYLGDQAVGNPVSISSPSGGVKEEIFTDMTVPDGTFNIRVEIIDSIPKDENAGNNVLLTALITPVEDADRDGVSDEEDNCPNMANADQKNVDGDAAGDACDNDKDGDGLTNAHEQTLGTDPLKKDTDGDGVDDATDLYPTGNEPPPPPPPKPEPAPEPAPSLATVSEERASNDSSTVESPEPVTEEASEAPSGLEVSAPTSGVADTPAASPDAFETTSPQAAFTYEQLRWGTYAFRAIAPSRDEGFRYEWDFGDGTTSNRRAVTHTFLKAGSYEVALRMTGADEAVVEDRVVLEVPFFDFENTSVRMLIVFLVVLLVLAGSVYVRLTGEGKAARKPSTPASSSTKKRSSKKTT